jgi:polyisoprenoid-binding protein YceI
MAIWKMDARHSRIQFMVRHLMISNVIGEFTRYEGTVESSEADFSDAKISFEADVDSIFTGNAQRDGHLKSVDFFDAGAFPTIKFVSKEIKKLDGENYKLLGDLTMRDKSLPVMLDVVFGGVGTMGNHTAAGFEIHGKINRAAFGLQWNRPTEAGGVAIGETVRIEITAELMEQV